MAGIVVGQYVSLPFPAWIPFVSALVLSVILWRSPLWQSVSIVASMAALGFLLVQQQQASLAVSWPDGEVCYEAVVTSEPQEKPKTMAVDIMLVHGGRRLKCYFYKDVRSRSLQIGDGLKLQSVIQPNREWRRGTFDYRRYLEIHGFTGSTVVSSWKWQKAKVSLTHLSRLERARLFFLRLRSRLLQRLNAAVPDAASADAYSIVAAMALGEKSALSAELKDLYAQTGASHVLALSGLHLGIIYTLFSFMVVRRRWQLVSQVALVTGIWVFVFLVGMSTSVVRSAVMLSVYALLSLANRNKMSLNTLAFTAIILLMVNPLTLFDVGFQMSFMAVFAILLGYPLLRGVFADQYLQEHRLVDWTWSMVAISCAAQVGVAPLIAYYFGRFSTCFLLTNFIVVPLAAIILYLTIVVLVVPALAPLLFKIVGMQNRVLVFIGQLPGASIEGLHPSVVQVVMTYVIIASVWLLCARFRRR